MDCCSVLDRWGKILNSPTVDESLGLGRLETATAMEDIILKEDKLTAYLTSIAWAGRPSCAAKLYF
jgi:hypothetical protein